MPQRIILRQADITFSRDFVDTLVDAGIILSRRNLFNRNGIIINHGNHEPIRLGHRVSSMYIINQPDYIRYCSNKMISCRLLPKYYPDYWESFRDVDRFPVIVKPKFGHHGKGIRIIKSRHELIRFFTQHDNSDYVIQDFINISHEFRFNVFDRQIFQVSEKVRINQDVDRNGIEFEYRSLGEDPDIRPRFLTFLKGIINDFHKNVGYNLGSYCLDVMKSVDGDYYLCEINSAYGIGAFTLDRLITNIRNKYINRELENYRVR